MFLLFTPTTFLFLFFYLLFIVSLLSTSNFLYFWVIIEILILLFMGLGFSLFINSISSLIVYFLVQTISSFVLLVSFINSFSIGMELSILLKLSIFPFHFWFLSVVYRFPNFLFFLSSTIHNLPIFFIISMFELSLTWRCFKFSCVVGLLVGAFIIITTLDYRFFLLCSSVANNSWLMAACGSSWSSFVIFFLVYFLSLSIVFSCFSSLTNPSPHFNSNVFFFTIFLSGLPPVPLFFPNMFVFSSLLSFCNNSPFFIWSFLVGAGVLLIGYISFILNLLVYKITSATAFTLY